MECARDTSASNGVSSSPPKTSSDVKRLRLDESGIFRSASCDETASCNESIDQNSTTRSSSEESSELENPAKSPMTIPAILAIMRKSINFLKSSNDLKDFPSKTDNLVSANFPFTVESPSSSSSTFPEDLQKMIDHSSADYEKSTKIDFMFDAPWRNICNDHQNRTPAGISYPYTEEQVKCYEEMKNILETKNFHVCVLTGESGTGKTIFLKQFCDDPEVDFVYVTPQNSLCKEGSRKLDIPFDSTMTVTRLSMMIFDFIHYSECIDYQEILKQLPTEKIESMGLPTMFKLRPRALDDLFTWRKKYPTGNRKLVICINKFNIINSSELYMIKCQLQRLVSAAKPEVNVILLLCGDPFELQPIFIPVSGKNDEPSKENLAGEAVAGSNRQRRLSGNAISTMKLGQTHFEFKHSMRADNPEYRIFLHNLKASTNFGKDALKFFENVSKVRKIPYKYCIRALLDMPAPNRKESVYQLGASYLCDIAGWVQNYGKDFNGVTFYSFKNTEVHHMNLSIALSVWQQCLLFNETAAEKGIKQIPPYLMPRLVPICFVQTNGRLSEGTRGKLGQMPVLPLIIGWRYKVLHSEIHLKLGEMVTLVHIEYKNNDSPNTYKNISHLLVVTTEGDLIVVRPGHFHMQLFQDGDGYLFLDESSNLCGSPNSSRKLYGFPLQLAFARTVRGSLGSPVEGDIYGNLTFLSAEEVYTLLARIHDPSQIKGLAWVK